MVASEAYVSKSARNSSLDSSSAIVVADNPVSLNDELDRNYAVGMRPAMELS